MDPSPSFRSEIYYQIAKFLENGPCEEAAAALRRGIEENQLVTPRYDWTGQGHNRTFRDMEEEYGPLPTDYHLKTCFDLCQQRTPDAWGVQSMMKWNRGVLPLQRKQLLTQLARRELGLNNRRPNQFQNFFHQQLSKNLKLLRKTLGHLSAIYCLVFDRSGRLVLTGADDQLVKCWSFVDGRLIHTYRGASAQISDICVSHDNKLVAAVSPYFFLFLVLPIKSCSFTCLGFLRQSDSSLGAPHGNSCRCPAQVWRNDHGHPVLSLHAQLGREVLLDIHGGVRHRHLLGLSLRQEWPHSVRSRANKV